MQYESEFKLKAFAVILIFCLFLPGCSREKREAETTPSPAEQAEEAVPLNESAPLETSPSEETAVAKEAGEIEPAPSMPKTEAETAPEPEPEPSVPEYSLIYRFGENGSLSGKRQQRVKEGGGGTPVTAVPAAGHYFSAWSDGSTANPRSDIDVRGDIAVTALFALNRYILDYTAGENGSIVGEGQQQVDHGESGTPVSAVPAAGHHFIGWSDGVTTAERTDENLAGDLAVRAEFAFNTYTLGGTVSGLAEGTTVVLQNEGGDPLPIAADGEFAFPDRLLNGSRYAVTVLTQPTSPNQTCTVREGIGSIDGADAAGIAVECTRNRYRIGGALFGLPKESEVALRMNGEADLVLRADGEFTFASPLEDGSPFEVVVSRQPQRPNWACTVENGVGTLAGSDVATVEIGCFPEVNLQAVAGRRKVELTWNSDDFPGGTFHLCRAREDFAPLGFDSCSSARNGAIESGVRNPLSLSPLLNDTPYWFQLQVITAGGRRTASTVVKAIPFGGLNDTGIDWCADDLSNRDQGGTRVDKSGSCETLASTHPGQDARAGRDSEALRRTLAKTGGGSTGFDFTKVCLSGEAAGQGSCPPNPALGDAPNSWGCTRDNTTGLLWEVKTESGLRSQGNTYSWYSPENERHGGDAGVQNGGSCEGGGCDTRAYVQAINASRLCGVDDWRLPTRKELLSIVDNSRVSPAIDTGFFPNTPTANFWSATPYVDQENSAWTIYFQYGEVYPAGKSQGNPVRLVRGRTATFGLENR